MEHIEGYIEGHIEGHIEEHTEDHTKMETAIKKYIQTFTTIDIIDYLMYVPTHDYPPLNFSQYQNYKIIGIYKSIYFITAMPDEYDHVHISIGFMHPMFWYHITDPEKLDQIINYYYTPPKTELKHFVSFVGPIKDTGINLEVCEKFLSIHHLSSQYVWGSLYTKFPKKKTICIKNSFQRAIHHTHALIQSEDSDDKISSKSKYSHSLISFVERDQEVYMEVEYHPLNFNTEHLNLNSNPNIPSDMPVDLMILIMNIPFKTITQLLAERPPKLKTAFKVVNGYVDCLNMFMDELALLVDMEDIDENCKKEGVVVLLKLYVNKEIDKIFKCDKKLYEEIRKIGTVAECEKYAITLRGMIKVEKTDIEDIVLDHIVYVVKTIARISK